MKAPAEVDDIDVHELSRRTGVPVRMDKTCWLRHEVELSFVWVEHGIQPIAMQVGAKVSAADVRKLGNVFDLCERYNTALQQLELIASGELLQAIIDRQEATMGYRCVRYFTLERETRILTDCLKELQS